MTETPRPASSHSRDPDRSGPASTPSHSPDVSRPADVSLEARASARRFLERLAARTPENERYEDQGEIARGGMGSIRRVQDQVLRRTLAMKVLLEREDDDDPDAASSAEVLLARFLEEAQVTGQLDHPGVVPVHDMGVDEKGRVWFTMRLVKGRNFEELIELVRKGEEGWTLTRAVQSVQRVCEAMAFAHSKGVVHRDLKPANVMVGRFGETYVMDWGLARVAGQPEIADMRVTPHAADSSTVLTARDLDAAGSGHSPQLTMAGSIVGTPAYMAPEQARGETDEVDERSDVYAVGSMLYHLLSGHRPYVPPGSKANALDVLRALTAGPPARITATDVPPELVAICDKAMARAKHDRYAGMLELGEDLQAYLEGRVVRAHETGARAEFVKWVGRNKLAAGALASAALVTLGGLGSIAWVTHAKNAQLAAARDAAVLQSYGASLSTANASLTLNAVEEARRRLEACDPELRGWEWSHLDLAANPLVRRIELATGPAADGAEPEPVDRVVWSPDGRRFALRFAKRLEVRDAVTAARIGVLPATEFALRTHAWSPDGNSLALADNAGGIFVWTPGAEAPPRKIGKHTLNVTALEFLPDGRTLLSSAGTCSRPARLPTRSPAASSLGTSRTLRRATCSARAARSSSRSRRTPRGTACSRRTAKARCASGTSSAASSSRRSVSPAASSPRRRSRTTTCSSAPRPRASSCGTRGSTSGSPRARTPRRSRVSSSTGSSARATSRAAAPTAASASSTATTSPTSARCAPRPRTRRRSASIRPGVGSRARGSAASCSCGTPRSCARRTTCRSPIGR
ncbi:MAG: serine/threonine-protein kinase [Planctomycetes bacterium]|nr:serine/threonine-protein kinase [Planctomycetota bacterium]